MIRTFTPVMGLLLAVLMVGVIANQTALATRATGLMLVAALLAGLADYQIRKGGPQAVVLGYWVAVAVRGSIALLGGLILGATLNRELWVNFALWLLTTYVLVLIVETVREVRLADNQQKEGSE
ncbi:MAG: hypothetical protein ACRC8S_16345 [Fimbriiglobus sp.]